MPGFPTLANARANHHLRGSCSIRCSNRERRNITAERSDAGRNWPVSRATQFSAEHTAPLAASSRTRSSGTSKLGQNFRYAARTVAHTLSGQSTSKRARSTAGESIPVAPKSIMPVTFSALKRICSARKSRTQRCSAHSVCDPRRSAERSIGARRTTSVSTRRNNGSSSGETDGRATRPAERSGSFSARIRSRLEIPGHAPRRDSAAHTPCSFATASHAASTSVGEGESECVPGCHRQQSHTHSDSTNVDRPLIPVNTIGRKGRWAACFIQV